MAGSGKKRPGGATGKQPQRSASRSGSRALPQKSGAQKRATGPQRISTTNRLSKPQPVRRKRQVWWKRWLKASLIWGLTAMLVLGTVSFVGLAIIYSRLEVPTPDDFAQAQSSTIVYADGTTEMGRLGVANRETVDFDTLPEHVGQVFVAAEDRTFYSNPGIDIAGAARAMFRTIVQGKKQGGSTITQQYVERYYVGKTTTSVSGKLKEALLALKIDQQQSKDEILGNYINTIYFGRGAYGIQAAAREYYGKDAADLTVSEAALLAGVLPAPSAWDPRLNPERAEQRWNYVLGGMVELGYLTPADRLKLTFPETIDYANENVFAGTEGYILRAAIDEVAREVGISSDDIETQGYVIVTTIDRSVQDAVEDAVDKIPADHAPNMRVAAVVMDPDTGAILGMYGGDDYLDVQRNAVTQDRAQAGSTFKPFALIAALEDGTSLKTVYDGNSPRNIPGFTSAVRNFANIDYGDVNLVDATAKSVNTAYAEVTHDVGAEAVVNAAIRAGIPADTAGLEPNPAVALGSAAPHPVDMASAYSTLAAEGLSTDPYLVQAVYDRHGDLVYRRSVVPTRVFSSLVMADTTYAMQQVVRYGSGRYANSLGRPIAGKTGTSSDNRSAWFVGFTPQIVGAVALYQVGEDGSEEEITPFGGFRSITGGSIPCRVWTWMMEDILADMPVEAFPARADIGSVPEPSVTPSPSPSPSPSQTPSPSPTPIVSATPSPDPTPTPSPSPDADPDPIPSSIPLPTPSPQPSL